MSKYKSKEELDVMTQKEIDDYRYQIIISVHSHANWHECDEKRYVDELEYYEHLRFKDEMLARYKRWSTLDKSPEDKLIASIFTNIKPENMYTFQTAARLKELGELKYIKP